jgi:pimeloyl-[acyl-carrier protein] methyl ester esterase
MKSPLHIESVGIGPPLVLLHGWGLHGGLFTPLLPLLMQRFSVHVVDLPGHGHSAACVPYDLATLVHTVHTGTAHIDGPLNVLGWSLGGMIAQAWALAHPTRIAALVLECTKPRFVKAQDWPYGTDESVLQSFVDGFSAAPDATMLRFLTLNVAGSEGARSVLAQLRRTALTRGPVQHVALTQGLEVLRGFDIRSQLNAITHATLVITGGLDRLTVPEVGPWYLAHLPRASLAHFERAAHAPHLTHAAEFARAVKSFLTP